MLLGAWTKGATCTVVAQRHRRFEQSASSNIKKLSLNSLHELHHRNLRITDPKAPTTSLRAFFRGRRIGERGFIVYDARVLWLHGHAAARPSAES